MDLWTRINFFPMVEKNSIGGVFIYIGDGGLCIDYRKLGFP
jgi:hypothetical protein